MLFLLCDQAAQGSRQLDPEFPPPSWPCRKFQRDFRGTKGLLAQEAQGHLHRFDVGTDMMDKPLPLLFLQFAVRAPVSHLCYSQIAENAVLGHGSRACSCWQPAWLPCPAPAKQSFPCLGRTPRCINPIIACIGRSPPCINPIINARSAVQHDRCQLVCAALPWSNPPQVQTPTIPLYQNLNPIFKPYRYCKRRRLQASVR